MSLTPSSKVNESVDKFGLFSVMNNTKWNALFSALSDVDTRISCSKGVIRIWGYLKRGVDIQLHQYT